MPRTYEFAVNYNIYTGITVQLVTIHMALNSPHFPSGAGYITSNKRCVVSVGDKVINHNRFTTRNHESSLHEV